MDEREFEHQAQTMLDHIEAAIESSGVDVDCDVRPGGVIELEFEDASKIIVNRHAAAREIWVAARSGGFHFRWDGQRWWSDREGAELMAVLSRLLAEQSGAPVALR